MNKNIIFGLLGVLFTFSCMAQEGNWIPLLDKELTYWDLFIGVPHHSITGLEDLPKGDGKKGTPLGLNNDPLNVFSTKDIDDETILHMSGEILSGLTSKEEYENYHLKLEFKWGEKKWDPRLNAKRDNGVLYHCNGSDGAFWNAWIQSQEFQIQEVDIGDNYGLAGAVNTIKSVKTNDGFCIYDPEGISTKLGTAIQGEKLYRCIRKENHENPMLNGILLNWCALMENLTTS